MHRAVASLWCDDGAPHKIAVCICYIEILLLKQSSCLHLIAAHINSINHLIEIAGIRTATLNRYADISEEKRKSDRRSDNEKKLRRWWWWRRRPYHKNWLHNKILPFINIQRNANANFQLLRIIPTNTVE